MAGPMYQLVSPCGTQEDISPDLLCITTFYPVGKVVCGCSKIIHIRGSRQTGVGVAFIFVAC